MTDQNIHKLATLADEFLTKLEVPTEEADAKPLALKLTKALTREEEDNLTDNIIGVMTCALEDDQDGINTRTLSVAEMFSKVAKRLSVEDEVAAAVSLNLTNTQTESELVAANAPTFAAIVSKARNNAPKS